MPKPAGTAAIVLKTVQQQNIDHICSQACLDSQVLYGSIALFQIYLANTK